ncbi:MAG: hypothetical protein LBQ19_01790, partial [Synergistaceae bacterium]|nr:hypothetical protein [Synergistaceae bacterium]
MLLSMFFNEKKREKLMERYYSLAAFERRAYRMLAVIYAPISVTKLTVALNAINDKKSSAKIKWDARANLGPLLAEWNGMELARNVRGSSGDCWICNRLVSELAIREAVSLGEFESFLRVIDRRGDLSGVNTDWGKLVFNNKAYFARELRRAIYLADEKRFLALVEEGRYMTSRELDEAVLKDIPPCTILAEILLNPIDVKIMEALPRKIFMTVLGEGEWLLSESRSERESLKKLLDRGMELYGDDPEIIERVAN